MGYGSVGSVEVCYGFVYFSGGVDFRFVVGGVVVRCGVVCGQF